MSPEHIGRSVVRAIERNDFYIFTHPEWKSVAEAQATEMLSAFGSSADPKYCGDNVEALRAAFAVQCPSARAAEV
jgi:hypothetical protein